MPIRANFPGLVMLAVLQLFWLNEITGQCQPEFLNAGEDITLSCGSELPEFSACEAVSSCCEGPVTVSTFTSETGDLLQNCTVTTAYGPGPDWSVWLPMLPAPSVSWHFVGQGNLQVYADGSGHLWGTIRNAADATLEMTIDLWFHNGRNWADWSALGRSYKNDLGYAGSNYQDWMYYELVPDFAVIDGVGSLSGSHLNLHHQPADFFYGFQMGLGANNKNANNGFSGWFTYDGIYNGASVEGHGDVNVDQTCGNENPECTLSAITQVCRAEDSCGNISFHTQTISVTDTDLPVIMPFEESISIPCSEVDQIFISAMDACSAVTITFTDEVISEGCGGNRIRHYMVSDACGNTVYADQLIFLLPEGEPEFTIFPEDIEIECSDFADLGQPLVEWIATCTGTEVVVSEETFPGDCPGNFVVQYTYTLTDACGNQVIQVWTVTVQDTTPPVIYDVPADAEISCGEEIPPAVPFALDNCDEEVTIALNAYTESLDCGYNFIRTWTATDDCGNMSTATQTIYVFDSVDPLFTFLPPSITATCEEGFELDMALVEDQCSSVELTWTDVPLGDCAGSYLRLWRAFDGCGNQALESTTVTLIDNTPPVMVSFPEDITANCGDIPQVDENIIQYEDNCGAVTVDFEENISEGDCASGYVVTRTWTLTDDCGNSSEWTWTISVSDNESPVLVGIPDDVVVNCGDEIPEAVVTAIDNCDENVSVSLSATTEEGTCGEVFTRTWTAIDACGNTTTGTQTVTLVDNQIPTFTFVPESVEIVCGQGVDLADLPLAVATDDCSDLVVSYADLPQGEGCDSGILRIFTATDGCGNTVSAEQQITLVDNEAPVFTFVPESQTIGCDGNIPSEITPAEAIDNCSTVTITYEDELSENGCSGGITRHWIATDACGNQTVADQLLSISDNESPVFTAFPEDLTTSCSAIPGIESSGVEYTDDCGNLTVDIDETITEGSCPNSYILERTWTISDACGNVASQTWTIYVVDEEEPVVIGVPENITIQCGDEIPEAVVSAIDNCTAPENIQISLSAQTEQSACGYIFIRIWTVTDQCGNTTIATQEITVVDNQAPYFTFIPQDINVSCGDIATLEDATAEDACSEVTVSTDIIPGDGCGSYTRVFTATDACGNSVMAEQVVNVSDFIPPVPDEVPPSTLVFDCSEIFEVGPDFVTFTDGCSDVDVEFEEIILPTDCPGSYSVVYNWYATDACGNLDVESMEVFYIDQTAPVILEGPADLNLSCGDEIPAGGILYTDDCSDVNVTYTDDQLPSDCGYTIVRTYTAEDACGNASSYQQIIQYNDESAPSFVSFPENVTVDCSNIPSIDDAVVEYTDDCSSVEVDVVEVITDGLCPNSYTIERTWTISDACGNSESQTWIIQVEDNQAPQILNVPPDMTIDCTEDIPSVVVFAFDNCTAEPMISLQATQETIGCTTYFSRRWTAEDECGNQSIAIQIITITDFYNPVLSEYPQDMVLNCGDAAPEVPQITATDNCDNDVSVEFFETVVGDSNCPDVIRTWCATDCTGNEECHSQTISYNNSNAGLVALNAWQSSVSEATIRATASSDGRWGVDIYDISGRLVNSVFAGDMSKGETRQFILDISQMNASIYFVRFTNGKNELATGFSIVR